MTRSAERPRVRTAEIVAVGSELLLGESVDTNSAWISTRLAELGIDVYRHTTVGDNVDRIAAVLDEACRRADAVIVSGGLGPTQDDLTRHAVARVAGVALERRHDLAEDIRAAFASRGRDMPANNLVQADLPAGARALPRVGTAPGFAADVGDAVVYCVPGVPRELQVMVDRDVLPELVDRAGGGATVSRVVRTAGMSESGVAECCAAVVDELDVAGNPTIAFLATRGETRVRVTGKAATRPAALALVDPVVDRLVQLLGAGVAGVDDEGVEHAVARLLTAGGWSVAVAESVTGGGVGARLVSVPGASDWFRGGLIVYATAAKTLLAGVAQELLDQHGPVSEPVAAALAAGTRDRVGSTVAMAVVGVAGPTTQGDAPVGTCIVGIAGPAAASGTRTLHLPGRNRADVQEFAASFALDQLRRHLLAAAGR